MTVNLIAMVSLLAGLALSTWLFVMVRSGFGRGVSKVEDLAGMIEVIDVVAFRNLISSEESRALRHRLPPQTYIKIQRLRTRAAIAYVLSVYRNAGLTMRLAQHLVSSNDTIVRREAEDIQQLSVQSRILAIRSLVKLTVSFVFPRTPVSLQELATSYINIADRVEAICTLTAPLYTSRVAAAFR